MVWNSLTNSTPQWHQQDIADSRDRPAWEAKAVRLILLSHSSTYLYTTDWSSPKSWVDMDVNVNNSWVFSC